ncbi:immunity 53 family protein [Microbispora sp. NBC_01189]|uniref:Imm53 family immunity protein n=1 Tax=Microbispora sp. NBC_01189 TaxID=2903583 RepID=UPI002E0E6D62|nr:immunity 53 family protein [Microbispora sp. NBC_01189]
MRQACTAPSPDPPGSSWWDSLRGFTHRFLSYTSPSRSPGTRPSGSAGPAPALSGLLPTLPGTSRIRLPSAPPACCDRPEAEVFHLHSINKRLTAHTLDNPGWSIGVDLVGTDLEGHAFDWRSLDRTEDDWIHIRSDGRLFQGACGPLNLAEMVAGFEKFATTPASAGSI